MKYAASRLRTWLVNKLNEYEYATPLGAMVTVRRYLGVLLVLTPLHIYLSYWFMQLAKSDDKLHTWAHKISLAHSTMILPSFMFLGMCVWAIRNNKYEQVTQSVIGLAYVTVTAYMTYLDVTIGGASSPGGSTFLVTVTAMSVLHMAPPYVTVPFFVFAILGSGVGMYALANDVYVSNPGLLVNLALAIPLTITLSVIAWSQFSGRVNLAKDLLATKKLLARTQSELDALVEIDPVTGLYNHRKFCEVTQLDFAKASRLQNKPSSNGLLLVDINYLGRINEDCGFDAGDKILKKTGKLLLREIRATDVAGRAYGDVFAVYLPSTSLEGALMVAEKLRADIEQYPMVMLGTSNSPRREFHVTVNIGVASGLETPSVANSTERSALYVRAEAALARSKRVGRNFITSVPSLRHTSPAEESSESAVASAAG